MFRKKTLYFFLCLTFLWAQFDWIDDGAPIRQGLHVEWQRTAGGGTDGEVIFGWSDTRDSMRDVYVQKIDASGKSKVSINPKWKHQCTGERWDMAERNIIENHTELGLTDAFRRKNGYEDLSGSWFTNKGQGRRYDHIFSSNNLNVDSAFYDHKPREKKLSDHSPLVVELSIL